MSEGNVAEKMLPKHVAIIMDGNGRWAQRKNLPRFRGHVAGVKRLEEIAWLANKMGIRVLTVFAFSTENWRRPPAEVAMLMRTLCTVLEKRITQLMKGDIRLYFIGQRKGIPDYVLKSLDRAMAKTKNNKGLILNLALNYGGRSEILDAVKQISSQVRAGQIAVEDITEDTINQALYTRDLPDPDLLIRTSGEQRISNFLLWQLSYAEFYFTKKYWPDFDEEEFGKAIDDYQRRERRYGRVSALEDIPSHK
jgi:undecaprenyl diphosphate synthase